MTLHYYSNIKYPVNVNILLVFFHHRNSNNYPYRDKYNHKGGNERKNNKSSVKRAPLRAVPTNQRTNSHNSKKKIST